VLENEDRVIEIRRSSDLDRLQHDDRLGLILAMEGVEALGYDPELIDIFFDLGVRMASLTWNRRNPFADGVAEPPGGGLSRIGRQLVRRMTELGIVLDLAHASERTFFDAVHEADIPLLVSHGACRGVHETPRNLSDQQLSAIAESDGVVGIMLVPLAIDPQRPTIERVIDHIDYAVAQMGIDHVGLGGDFMRQTWRALGRPEPADSLLLPGTSMDATIEDLAGPDEYPSLVQRLRLRGYDGERLEALLGGNLLRLFRRILSA
jgi:membrane dipeptidase